MIPEPAQDSGERRDFGERLNGSIAMQLAVSAVMIAGLFTSSFAIGFLWVGRGGALAWVLAPLGLVVAFGLLGLVAHLTLRGHRDA